MAAERTVDACFSRPATGGAGAEKIFTVTSAVAQSCISEDPADAVADLRSQFGDDGYLVARCATRLSSSRGGEDLDVPVGSVHADPLPILDQLRGVFYPDDGRHAVFPCDHCAMGHQAPDLGHQAGDRDEQG